jgi:hypothetical protein
VDAHRILNIVKLGSWADLALLADKLPGWVYRGHRSVNWRLTSKLERNAPRGALNGLYEEEQRALVEFRARRLEMAPEPMPADDDPMSWFALMQHYGEPTRFVDFTESMAVAAYFALVHERGVDPAEDAAIWAVNTGILGRMLQQQLAFPDGRSITLDDDWVGGGLFNYLFGRGRIKDLGASGARAACTNPRMLRQKGLFVYALNLERTLEDNLYGVYSLPAEDAHRHEKFGYWDGIDSPSNLAKLRSSPVVKIILPTVCHEAVRSAVADFGLTYAALFPDTDVAAA